MVTKVISQNSGADYTGVTDTQIKEGSATTNYASSTYMEATSYDAGDRTWALLFIAPPSLGGAIAVSAATLSVRQESAETGTRTIDLHALLRGADTATWNTYDGTNNWGTAGAFGAADINGTALDSRSVAATVGFKDWSSAALAAYVETQINAGQPMRFLLKRNPAGAQDFTFNNFSQSGDADGNRPYLTFSYELAAPLFSASVF